MRDRPGPTNPQQQKRQNPLDGGFKLCDEVITLNTVTQFLRTAIMFFTPKKGILWKKIKT
ncbi:hypothetical protein AW085_14580 [Escherichia coli]|nr:hypothetical protein AW085_14580 [Escherichia coli]